jgi:HD-like signal output (HDOD) protein
MFKLFKRRKRDATEIIQHVFGHCELPSFPGTIMDLLEMLRQPDVSLAEVARHVEREPGLSVKVLRTVNSASFGLSTTVNHIGHAASLLGRSRLESIVLSVAVRDSLPSGDLGAFNHRSFWSTAAKRACLARTLAKHLHPHSEFESFTAGLLQDMGIPLLFMQKSDQYGEVYQHWQANPTASLVDLEHEAFGFDHTDVGAIIGRAWNLPDYLVDAISEHHNWQGDRRVDEAVRLVSLLRDDHDDDGIPHLIEVGATSFQADAEVLTDLIARGLEQARTYQQHMLL